MSFKVLAVIVLGCCLVSTVAAFCGGCAYCSAEPAGGWGPPAEGKYWGMTLDEILNSPDDSTTAESDYWQPPPLVLPTSNASTFAGLHDYLSKVGDSQLLPGLHGGIVNPDPIIKPTVTEKIPYTWAFTRPDVDISSTVHTKPDQMSLFTNKPVF